MSGLLALPDAALGSGQPLGRLLLERGACSFRAAAAHVHQLPYGRTSQPDAYAQVLTEGRGTCSNKHALLAALAREHALDVQLRLGLFEMDEANTPGVGTTLRKYGLESIPEAHCYLLAQGERVDLTHPGSSGTCSVRLLHEVQITPDQIGAMKRGWHREQVALWCAERDLDVARVWNARERCIRVLSGEADA